MYHYSYLALTVYPQLPQASSLAPLAHFSLSLPDTLPSSHIDHLMLIYTFGSLQFFYLAKQ